MAHSVEVEIDRNYAAFKKMLRSLLPENEGRYALLKDRTLRGLFDTPGDAVRAGDRQFGEDRYSIQQITEEPVDLGFYSCALHQG